MWTGLGAGHAHRMRPENILAVSSELPVFGVIALIFPTASSPRTWADDGWEKLSGEPHSGSLKGGTLDPLPLEGWEPPPHTDTHPAQLPEAGHPNPFAQALPIKQATPVVQRRQPAGGREIEVSGVEIVFLWELRGLVQALALS